MKSRKIKKSTKVSKKLIAVAVISILVFCATTATVAYKLFYRKSEAYEYIFPDFVGSYEADLPDPSDYVIKKNYISSDIYPEGVVISQSPDGLSEKKIPIGQTPTLTLTVSLGRERFEMPNLSGLTLQNAKIELARMQCKVMTVRLYGDFEDERVAYSSRAAGSRVYIGDEVVIYVQTPRRESTKYNGDTDVPNNRAEDVPEDIPLIKQAN